MTLIRRVPWLKPILFVALQPEIGVVVVTKKRYIQTITKPNGDEAITAAKIIFDTVFNPVLAPLGPLAENFLIFRTGAAEQLN